MKYPVLVYEDFAKGYMSAALMSSIDSDGNPLNHRYRLRNFAPETLERVQADCVTFFDRANLIQKDAQTQARAGFDFWMTRNCRETNFLDNSWGDDANKFFNLAHEFPPYQINVAEDGQLRHEERGIIG